VTAAARLSAAERRRELIETAIRVFGEGSYRGTTTAEIARAAGVSEPILYRHFASKRDLYLAALDHLWGQVRQSWQATLSESHDACEAVDAIGTKDLSARSSKLQLAELWVQALAEAADDRELRRHLRRHMREVHDLTAAMLRRGQEEGVIARGRDADAEAWIFLAGGILGLVARRIGVLAESELAGIRAARLDWLRS
jgi:AcrR family transcriptional regulator